MAYPWYTLIEEQNQSIEQGDFINDCPILIPQEKLTLELTDIKVGIKLYDVIIISQSCDLEQKKIDIVQVCPFRKLDDIEYIKNADSLKDKLKRKDQIRKGLIPYLHLLNVNSSTEFPLDFTVVDFRYIFGVEYDYLVEHVKTKCPRIRINPPYKEHLSQAFARYFMRVGLPTNIPEFYTK